MSGCSARYCICKKNIHRCITVLVLMQIFWLFLWQCAAVPFRILFHMSMTLAGCQRRQWTNMQFHTQIKEGVVSLLTQPPTHNPTRIPATFTHSHTSHLHTLTYQPPFTHSHTSHPSHTHIPAILLTLTYIPLANSFQDDWDVKVGLIHQ